jgi:nitrate reductase NapE
MSMAQETIVTSPRRREIAAFLLLTAVLTPLLAVGVVGAYGFAVWTYQMFAGPPGPPH